MKPRLLDLIRCPACRGQLRLHEAVFDGPEVARGTLLCGACNASYPVREGIPRLLHDPSEDRDASTKRTSTAFGFLWNRSVRPASEGGNRRTRYHFDKMATTLGLSDPEGLVLDAGAGDGIDLANHGSREGVEVVGVELSDGGCRASAARIRGIPTAHIVQGDLRRLPFADGTFDRVYSYGVLHHIPWPDHAASEIARVSRANAEIAVYLYEDFSERAVALRMALALINSARVVTTRLPPPVLYAMCQLASPFVYVLLTVPHLVLRSVPGFRRFAASLPFRHGRGPFALAGDLYDRFSAPIEYRYSRHTAAGLLADAGLTVTKVGLERGWMVAARRFVPTAVTGADGSVPGVAASRSC